MNYMHGFGGNFHLSALGCCNSSSSSSIVLITNSCHNIFQCTCSLRLNKRTTLIIQLEYLGCISFHIYMYSVYRKSIWVHVEEMHVLCSVMFFFPSSLVLLITKYGSQCVLYLSCFIAFISDFVLCNKAYERQPKPYKSRL